MNDENFPNPADLTQILNEETAKRRKLEILFGQWWKHYAVPYEFLWTLYSERETCLYCGARLASICPGDELGKPTFLGRVHLDHMDPLSRGGEDSIRNAVYVCETCNLSKRNRLFIEWLGLLEPGLRPLARQAYIDKHGHPPEDFQPSARQPRLTLPRIELKLDESVLRQLFPKPIVSGPPDRS